MTTHHPAPGFVSATVKRKLSQWPVVQVVAYMADDALTGVRHRMGRIGTTSGSHSQRSPEEMADYIERVFTQYKRLASVQAMRGRVAELGPGDNAGVALLIRKDGCEHIDLIDRFYSARDPEKQRQLYEILSRRHDLDAFRLSATWDEQQLAGIQWTLGVSAEEYFDRVASAKEPAYDYILSTAVMEHLYDPLGALRSMFASLKPGGRMIHVVDLRDHGMFTPVQPELTFLTISTPIYRRMTRNSGRPNRILMHRYRETLEALRLRHPLEFTLMPTILVGVGEYGEPQVFEEIAPELTRTAIAQVESCRQRFASEFKQVESRDLAVASFILVVHKSE